MYPKVTSPHYMSSYTTISSHFRLIEIMSHQELFEAVMSVINRKSTTILLDQDTVYKIESSLN